MVVPSVSMARLLAAGRPGRSGSVVGVPLAGDRGAAAARPGAVLESRTAQIRRTTGSSPGSRRWSPAMTATRPRRSSPPVAENARALIDDRFSLTDEAAAILQAAAAFDPRAALAIVDALPEDPEPKPGPAAGRSPAFSAAHQARRPGSRSLALSPFPPAPASARRSASPASSTSGPPCSTTDSVLPGSPARRPP